MIRTSDVSGAHNKDSVFLLCFSHSLCLPNFNRTDKIPISIQLALCIDFTRLDQAKNRTKTSANWWNQNLYVQFEMIQWERMIDMYDMT